MATRFPSAELLATHPHYPPHTHAPIRSRAGQVHGLCAGGCVRSAAAGAHARHVQARARAGGVQLVHACRGLEYAPAPQARNTAGHPRPRHPTPSPPPAAGKCWRASSRSTRTGRSLCTAPPLPPTPRRDKRAATAAAATDDHTPRAMRAAACTPPAPPPASSSHPLALPSHSTHAHAHWHSTPPTHTQIGSDAGARSPRCPSRALSPRSKFAERAPLRHLLDPLPPRAHHLGTAAGPHKRGGGR